MDGWGREGVEVEGIDEREIEKERIGGGEGGRGLRKMLWAKGRVRGGRNGEGTVGEERGG